MNIREIEAGVSALHYEWGSIEEACAGAEEFGLGIIEFSYRDGECLERPFERENLEEIKKAGRDFAGRIRFSLHAWFDIPLLGVIEGAEKLKRTAAFSHEAGAKEVVVHMGSHPDRGKGLSILAGALERAARDFEAARVNLLLENHYSFDYRGLNELGGEPGDFLEVFGRIDSPNLGFCLDYGHSHMCGNTAEFIRALSPRLEYAHLADNFGEEDTHLPFGEGSVDWSAALEQTLNTGFRGPFIVEYPATAETVSRFRDFLQKILRQGAGRDNI